MKIAVFGLGYVGLTTAVCLASEAHSIVGVDTNDQKIKKIAAGESPIREPGLDKLLAESLAHERLTCTTDSSLPIRDCDMAIVCVGTPSAGDGSHDMRDIAEVTRQIALAIAAQNRTQPLTVVYRSTIRPGTIEELIMPIFNSILREPETRVEVVYNPEFLREASAIHDFFHPPKIVIGTKDGTPNARMDEMNKDKPARVFNVRYRESEFTKFVDNSFHGLKIAYANEIGRLCVNLDIDAKTVHEIFVSDTKLNVSPAYLRPGGAFGGSCLPKDIRALQYISQEVGAGTHVVDSLMRSNEAHKHFLFLHVTSGLAPGANVLMLGMAFKADTDDLRESPNVDIARKLLRAGYKLFVYDPCLESGKLIGQNLGYAFSHLPGLTNLLVSKEIAEQDEFDLVIDTSDMAHALSLRSTNVMNIYRV